MHVATSVIEDQPLRATPAEGETLYEFSQSPLLERQSRQESNARSYPRRIPLALKKARGCWWRTSRGVPSSIAWPAPAPWRWGTTIRW